MQPCYTAESTQSKGQVVQWLLVALMIYLLLVAVGMIGSGFKWVSGGAEGARQLFAFFNLMAVIIFLPLEIITGFLAFIFFHYLSWETAQASDGGQSQADFA